MGSMAILIIYPLSKQKLSDQTGSKRLFFWTPSAHTSSTGCTAMRAFQINVKGREMIKVLKCKENKTTHLFFAKLFD